MDLRTLEHSPILDASSGLPLDVPFTRAVARAEGVPRHLLTWLCGRGLLRQPLAGVYVAAQLPDSTRLRVDCLSLVVPEDCVVSDRHAGWLLGAEMALAPNEHLNIQPIRIVRPPGHGRLRNALADSGERDLRPEDVTEIHGLPVTTALRTAWDLGMVRSRERALSGMDAMLRLPDFPHDAFLEGVQRFPGRRWVRTLRTYAPLADGRAASPGESVLRLRWLDTGLPAPEPQHEVWDGGILVAVLDLACPELGYAAEYDGAEWHGSPDQRAHDRERRAKVAALGTQVDVFVAADVFGQHRDAETRLVAGAARARARRRVGATTGR